MRPPLLLGAISELILPADGCCVIGESLVFESDSSTLLHLVQEKDIKLGGRTLARICGKPEGEWCMGTIKIHHTPV